MYDNPLPAYYSDRYYSDLTLSGISGISLVDIISWNNYKTFKFDFYNVLEQAYSQHKANNPTSYEEGQETIFFRILRFSGTRKAEQSYYSNPNNYWVLDFSKPLSDPRNELNIRRIYTAFLDGKCIRFSSTVSRLGTRVFPRHVDIIAEFTNLGVRRIREDLSQGEGLLNAMVTNFLSDTLAPICLQYNLHYLRMPHTSPGSFFDLVFLAGLDETRERDKFTLVNSYIDFKKLDNIIQSTRDLDINSINKWNILYFLYKRQGNRLISRPQLEMFVNIFVDIRHRSDLTTTIDYDAERYYSQEEYSITIFSEFWRALQLGRYVDLSF